LLLGIGSKEDRLPFGNYFNVGLIVVFTIEMKLEACNEALTPSSAFSTYGGPPLSVPWYHLFKIVCMVHNTNNNTRKIIRKVFIVLHKNEHTVIIVMMHNCMLSLRILTANTLYVDIHTVIYTHAIIQIRTFQQ
jgi:hypothetical protein